MLATAHVDDVGADFVPDVEMLAEDETFIAAAVVAPEADAPEIDVIEIDVEPKKSRLMPKPLKPKPSQWKRKAPKSRNRVMRTKHRLIPM